ncbi:hypothetical protein GUITHDRAFT_122979 [Guillardia theta CCMP2712]|uniref:Uncharacterized protein n=1 Tax=Guillardia theta (strain CCMP2712) TaxID=905079 RepID=L1I3L3_GUITC|nr:hypothetical protein GUITHDRAFT_122979 [Guillardia theta CCMP2712]EKX30808.1 hypothetical protein GUITHDRAFT_122979 [Guillardia theta CCMP2712]|eukprot:XP_005817788.1 hypothetical protein GUITHDRAFT_122979 [Guillardia theta CCMP2712]
MYQDAVEADLMYQDAVEADLMYQDAVEADLMYQDAVEADLIYQDAVEADLMYQDAVEADLIYQDAVEADLMYQDAQFENFLTEEYERATRLRGPEATAEQFYELSKVTVSDLLRPSKQAAWISQSASPRRRKSADCLHRVKAFQADGLKKSLLNVEPTLFPLIRFRGLDEKEEKIPKAPHPLLLSLRSMNSMTNFPPWECNGNDMREDYAFEKEECEFVMGPYSSFIHA